MTLFQKKEGDINMETFIYLQDLDNNGEIFFNVDYEIKYPNGYSRYGNGMGNLEKILKAYGFEDSKKLFSYFRYMFEYNKDAFKEIIADVMAKGICLSVDESEYFE